MIYIKLRTLRPFKQDVLPALPGLVQCNGNIAQVG